MKPKISVIISAYNEQDYINMSLDSLDKQSFPDFETIVVADSCTDSTAEIAKRYGCKILKANTRNLGKNRNIGAKEAKAEILVFLDADVAVSKDYLSKVYAAVNEGHECGRPRYYIKSNNFFIRNILFFVNISKAKQFPYTHFITKRCLTQAGGYPKYQNWQDMILADKVKKRCNFCIIDSKASNSDRAYKKKGVLWEIYFHVFSLKGFTGYFLKYRLLGIKKIPEYEDIR